MSMHVTAPSALRSSTPAPIPGLVALRRIWGLMYRHLALYRRSWPRLLDLCYWPILQMTIWGFTSKFFAARIGSHGAVTIGVLLGGVLLWEMALRSHLGFAVTFMEEIWSRNLGHVFISPLRPWEMLAALIAMSALRTFAGILPAAILAALLYHFSLLSIGPVLVLFALNLMIMGWWVALACVSLILSHGGGAESLVWSILAGLAPFAAVYYPVAIMPHWLQPLVLLLPAAHVFEGMRDVLAHGVIDWGHLAWAAGLNALWMSVAIGIFWTQFQTARTNGSLMNIGE